MSEPIDNEAPLEDVLEQQRVAKDDDPDDRLPDDLPNEVDDADYRDQRREVPVEDDDR